MRARIEAALLTQRGSLIGWVPVCLGIGVGTYFALRFEPDVGAIILLGLAALLMLLFARLAAPAYMPLLIALALVLSGVCIAKLRVTALEAPVLTFRYYGPIQGRVVSIDRSSSDAMRLTLDGVVLSRMGPQRTPTRVRVSIHGDEPHQKIAPGDIVILTGHLSPPSGPAEPGGFDFQRHAWFLKLGGVGYTRTPVLRLRAAQNDDIAAHIFATRMAISQAVQREMPGETGAFAAAIMTGDRSAIGQTTLTNLRRSNLAHLLAISGLHMGLLTGFVFAFIRYALAAVPGLALIWPLKKVAAGCALVVGAGYLALSGGSVSTERAFIMVAVMLVAILIGRRALTLRAVAIAASLVLLWQPEALIGPGFQMSFAATTALVFVFGQLRRFDMSRFPKWTRFLTSTVLSSLVAGLATAPFAAAHFNQIAHYGLIANIVSVPLMGALVMPAAVLAVCLAPFGLWGIGLSLMEVGLRWILFVAGAVAGQEGATGHVVAPDWFVLPLLSFGLLWLILVVGRGRWAGAGIVVAAFVFWVQTDRPDVLVADSGGLIGIMGKQGRALSKPRGDGFVSGIWLENDGRPTPQEVAAGRAGLDRVDRVTTAHLDGWRILQVSGKTALAGLDGCAGAHVLISNQADNVPRPCEVYDIARLRRTGALAIDVAQDGDLLIRSAHELTGQRPWNRGQDAIAPVVRLPLETR